MNELNQTEFHSNSNSSPFSSDAGFYSGSTSEMGIILSRFLDMLRTVPNHFVETQHQLCTLEVETSRLSQECIELETLISTVM
jgi:hypothetical protein